MSKKPRASSARLTAAERRERFVVTLLADPKRNATKAAIGAGFSAKTAYSAGSRLLKHVEVARVLKAREAEVVGKAMEKVQLTADEMIDSLARDVRFDPAKLYNADGSMKQVSEMDEATRRALRGVESDEIRVGDAVLGHTSKVKFPEQTAAREQGFKHFGLYKAHQEQSGRAAGAAAGAAVGRAVAEALDFDAIEARVAAKLKARLKRS